MASESDLRHVYVSYDHKRDASGRELAKRAAQQHGVVTAKQLVSLGFSRHQVGDMADRGHLHRLYRGVYAVGHVKLTRDGRLMAALLAAGRSAFLSHRTAVAMHQLRSMNLRRIEVTVVGGPTRKIAGVVVHRTRTAPVRGELTTVNGLTVSTVPRLLVELSATETKQELTKLITVAVRKHAFSHDSLERALEHHAGRPGIGTLKAAYAAYRPHPDRKSTLELAFDELLEQHPEIPEPLRNVDSDAGELDYYWPDHDVVLELDGRPYHLAVEDIERDRLKDAKLLTQGIRPLRVTDRRFEHDATGAITDLKALLQLG
jgi:hypothetical protein